MSPEIKYQYEFGDFRLDVKEKTLMRGEEQISLTPKAFEMLCFFIENPGRLIEKDELMESLWGDSFVEESNLTFNIRQLRIALHDNVQNPTFIKTVPRHGYRFIAPVKKAVKEESVSKTTEDISRVVSETTSESFSQHISKPNYAFIGLAVLLIAGLAGAVILYGYFRDKKPNSPILSAPFAIEKISANGKVTLAIISPDGKKVIYTNGRGSDKQSIWLRYLEDGSNTNIIPPSDDFYYGLAISPDGETLYFVRHQPLKDDRDIYRAPIFGGIPQKITDNTEGWISVSPDGTKISFVRCPRQNEDYCSLYIANASDGQNERKIYTSSRPFRIGDNQFSPDGKKIAFAIGQSANGANEFGLTEIDLESGALREMLKEKFFNIKSLAWLPDQDGLLMTARKSTESNFRIMLVFAATGETQLLTKDSEIYSVLSLDKEAKRLICTKVKQDFRLKLMNLDNPADNRVLTDATSVAFAPNGKIYFASGMSGNSEIWSISPDGSNQRQLTNNPADDAVPIISPHGNSIFFTSNRTGVAQVWQMNTDGSNQTQITQGEGGRPLFVSSEGNWIYYHQSLSRTLRRVYLKNGEDQLVFNKVKAFFGISPDGTQAAYAEKQGDETVLEVADLNNGQIIKTFPLADGKSDLQQILWMPDRKSILYVTANREFQDFTLWKQAIDSSSPVKIAALGDKEFGAFALPVSPDDKIFAVVQGEWLHDAVLLKGLK